MNWDRSQKYDGSGSLLQTYYLTPDPQWAVEAFKHYASRGEFKKQNRFGLHAFFAKIIEVAPTVADAIRALAKEYGVTLPSEVKRVRTGAGLDAMWSYFFVTGDAKYVKEVMKARSHLNQGVRSAAAWSLTAIAKTDAKVRALLLAEAN